MKLFTVNVSLNPYRGQAVDQKLNERSAQRENASSQRMRTTKQVVDKRFLKEMSKLGSNLRTEIGKRCPDGMTVESMLPELNALVEQYNSDQAKAVERFIKKRPEWLKDAREKATGLGDAFREADYPTDEALRDGTISGCRWKASLFVAPMASELVLDTLSDEIRQDTEDKLSTAMTERFGLLVSDLRDKTVAMVRDLRDRINAEGKDRTGRYTRAIHNLRLQADLIASFGTELDSEELATAGAKLVKTLKGLTDKDIKQDAKRRTDTVSSFADALDLLDPAISEAEPEESEPDTVEDTVEPDAFEPEEIDMLDDPKGQNQYQEKVVDAEPELSHSDGPDAAPSIDDLL